MGELGAAVGEIKRWLVRRGPFRRRHTSLSNLTPA